MKTKTLYDVAFEQRADDLAREITRIIKASTWIAQHRATVMGSGVSFLLGILSSVTAAAPA